MALPAILRNLEVGEGSGIATCITYISEMHVSAE